MATDEGSSPNEVEISRMSLRNGGWIGYSEDAVFVVEGDERIKIRHEAVESIALRTLEFDIAVMSLLLLAVGGWVVASRNPLVGAGFIGVGLFSLYRTYQQRHELVISVSDNAPVAVHPEHPSECHETLVTQIREE